MHPIQSALRLGYQRILNKKWLAVPGKNVTEIKKPSKRGCDEKCYSLVKFRC